MHFLHRRAAFAGARNTRGLGKPLVKTMFIRRVFGCVVSFVGVVLKIECSKFSTFRAFEDTFSRVSLQVVRFMQPKLNTNFAQKSWSGQSTGRFHTVCMLRFRKLVLQSWATSCAVLKTQTKPERRPPKPNIVNILTPAKQHKATSFKKRRFSNTQDKCLNLKKHDGIDWCVRLLHGPAALAALEALKALAWRIRSCTPGRAILGR